jgi:hypothetical protein
MRTFVRFRSTSPDNEIPDQSGVRTEHAGRELAESLRNALQPNVDMIGEVKNHDDFAWDIECKVDRAVVWVEVGFVEEKTWLATVELHPWWLNPTRGRSGTRARLVVSKALDQALKGDDRIDSIRWFTRKEWDEGPQIEGEDVPC